ncbi:sensor histidine kinase [Microbacterium thalassium]|uniref:histidine kinase n=1 Tax=Microbacterium thalassium TaxID=362649 RepID=A0A7X0FRV1_9MICO|nr:HAMP domain-containing sensor histidine kinase [Microbacterium thalassium]MBB6392384.1 signal transduction histidine kinase [Microbacterium thalassium]GLK25083.1 two-component sensor histidine kinase [Microbacterium thalassium]
MPRIPTRPLRRRTTSARPLSAAARILGAILAVAFVGLVLVGGITFVVQWSQVLDAVDDRLTQQVDRLNTVAGAGDAAEALEDDTASETLAVEDYTTVEAYLYDVVAWLVPARNEGSIAVIDGVVRFRPGTLSGFEIPDADPLVARVVEETERTGGTVLGTAATAAGALRYIAIPVTVPGDAHSGIYVRAVNLGAELAPVTSAMRTYAIAATIVLLATGVVGWFVARRLLRPIRHLREAASAITLDDLSPRLHAHGDDDIADLSRTVNSMLDRLEDSVDGQRQLLDDVRHELKTPITIVRGHLELMDPADASDVAATRDIGIAELDRMSRLVADIDLLAAAEDDAYTMAEVDLGSLTARVGELVTVIPGHRWTIESAAQGVVPGDADRLLQAWLQLADNAAKYTPRGAPIEIGSALDDVGASLWVRDHGPGIPPAARFSIFRRFDRADTRREVGGSGLGLAIVDAIVRTHGGACRITDTPGGGATFTIHLPGFAESVSGPVSAGDVVLQRKASE